MAPSSDTHTCSCMKKSTTFDDFVVVSSCCGISPPYSLALILQSISFYFASNPFHEHSPQYIEEDILVTWIENDPKISGMPAPK
jgi:hypothetical protein